MNYSTFKFALDLQVLQSQVSIPVTFGDTARKLYITLTDGGVPFQLKEGFKVVLSGRKSDGTMLYDSCVLDLKNSAITYHFREQTATAPGMVQCELIIYAPDKGESELEPGEELTYSVMGTPRFIIMVDERVNDDTTLLSTDSLTAIVGLVDSATEIASNENLRVEAEKEREANETQRIINEEERKLRAKSDVGIETDEGGEIFNDYYNNRAGSRAFTIVGVESNRYITNAMRTNGYDGFIAPTARLFNPCGQACRRGEGIYGGVQIRRAYRLSYLR